MSITIERTPLILQWEGQEIQVEQLGIRLPFARKPENLKDMSTSGDYIIYVTETRAMTPEEFDGRQLCWRKSCRRPRNSTRPSTRGKSRWP